MTTSLLVAEVFGKEHSKVVRDIESLSCSASFNAANFGVITYIDSRNREQTAYEMTKDGFSFLVMGYTGAKAGEFKERFINEFNRREALLKDDDYILMRSQQILQKRIEIAEEKIKCLEQQNSKLQPKADFADKAFKKILFSFGGYSITDYEYIYMIKEDGIHDALVDLKVNPKIIMLAARAFNVASKKDKNADFTSSIKVAANSLVSFVGRKVPDHPVEEIKLINEWGK